jgi:hypothetical protein
LVEKTGNAKKHIKPTQAGQDNIMAASTADHLELEKSCLQIMPTWQSKVRSNWRWS